MEEGLLSRLEVIEGQPLAERAEAYANLHGELSARLDAGDAPPTRGTGNI
ncbi:hypothetical protein Lxx06150 [Leifsonia xyli subsp. xyli str. CTCB07]|uniref:Uncharacterized protein n=1 Tax=Leifsonia xyli subsp. xyli (strain CTCB07) TaxID=281090 RepID=Q6AGC1_LEIXX|nr:hypothetical protein Lxx06150 [Leifsonia xyli subsp. xyli str. CTCB07]